MKNLTGRTFLLSVLLPLFVLLPMLMVVGADGVSGDDFVFVERAFRTGSARELSGHFGVTVDMKILDSEEVYGKNQAELLLEDFFRRNAPISFTVTHRNVRSTSAFLIGDFQSSGGTYRVNVYLKSGGSGWQVTQLQILRKN